MHIVLMILHGWPGAAGFRDSAARGRRIANNVRVGQTGNPLAARVGAIARKPFSFSILRTG